MMNVEILNIFTEIKDTDTDITNQTLFISNKQHDDE